MKKVLLCFVLLFAFGCVQQSQEQKQTINYKIMERANFNTVPWATIDLIEGIGEKKLSVIKKEFDKGQFKSGKDFEERMTGILAPSMIGNIGDKYDFEVVE